MILGFFSDTDGDVAGVIMTSQKEIDVDIYFGTGGAPEGAKVLAVACGGTGLTAGGLVL